MEDLKVRAVLNMGETAHAIGSNQQPDFTAAFCSSYLSFSD